ncbi:hypothetical protein [Bradyrhizobium pachyrhizi]|uniref:hypothetical protein n=1 Tax=Bradyrhizobium pachyrhizi TaxID=280333 RepID=UPI00128ED8DB|nr:hypothetical protein [Bradyrhizobium pachyrhizi]
MLLLIGMLAIMMPASSSSPGEGGAHGLPSTPQSIARSAVAAFFDSSSSANVAGPTLSSLGGEFGLAPLLGKTLAVISDARFVGKNSNVVVEGC